MNVKRPPGPGTPPGVTIEACGAQAQNAGGDGAPHAVAQLQREVEYLKAFRRSVGHDLRNPLCAVDGLVRLLLEGPEGVLPRETRETVVAIGHAVAELSTMLDGLRALSDADVDALNLDDVDLSVIAHAVAAGLAKRYAHRVALTVDAMPPVRTDARLMTIVLSQLLGNAWEFTARVPAAAVHVGAHANENGSVTCFVRDNGVGFDASAAQNIFLPFKPLHASRSLAGNGVGLATVKSIFDRLGGRVWAEGAQGNGACFYFTVKQCVVPTAGMA